MFRWDKIFLKFNKWSKRYNCVSLDNTKIL